MAQQILLIEDNEQDQKIIARYFKKAGLGEVTVVDNGEDGVAHARQNRPDVILIDTLLPGMDGFETCRQLKTGAQPDVPVIMMTGQIDAVDAQKAKDMGADEYCVKTSDCAQLIDAVRKLAGRRDTGQKDTDRWAMEKTNMAIKSLYKELEKKNEELREMDRLKSKFVSTVSHELRTPLTIIKSAVSQVLDGIHGEITEPQRKKLNMALNSANSLRRIIDDLLDVAKLEARRVELKHESFDIVRLARDLAEGFDALARDKGLTITVNASKPSIDVEADRDRIAQVLTNLIGNAIKFTGQGGIEVLIDERLEFIECSVSDTGRGIAPEDLPKVFDRFQQFGKSYAPGQEGTGLGLSICKEIIELHCGHISVSSEPGRGSTFTFTIPRAQNKQTTES